MKMRNMKRGLSTLLAVIMLLASFTVVVAESVELMAVADPVITFKDGGTVDGVRKIEATITCSSSGAVIYYTTNGSNPTKSSSRYSGSLLFDESEDITLKAIAYQSASSSTSSKVVSKNKVGYRLTVTRDPSDNSDPNPSEIVVTIEGLKAGEVLRYTVDGKTPETSGAYREERAFHTEIHIRTTTVLMWQVFREGYEPTNVRRATVTAKDWPDKVLLPSWRKESFYGGVRLIGEVETDGATIYYRTAKGALNSKNEYPTIKDKVTEKDTRYTAPLEFTEVGMYTIKAYAMKAGISDSNQVSVNLKIEACSTPNISVGSATGGRKKVTITAKEGEEIYFTRNGTTPTRSSERYTEPIYIGTPCTVRAIAIRQGYVNSGVASKSVTGVSGGDVVLTAPVLGDVMESPVGIKTVALSATDPAVQIRYNITTLIPNGSDIPSASKPGTLYTEPIVFDQNGTRFFVANTAVENNGKYTFSSGNSGYIARQINVTRIPETDIIKSLSGGVKTVTFRPNASGDIYYVIRPGTNNFLTADMINQTDENRYIYPITVSETSSLSAVTIKANGSRSVVYNTNISISGGSATPGRIPAPTVNYVIGGVTIDCSDTAADIFYVLDNSPDTVATAAGTPYERGSVINVTGSGYIHVVAMKPGFTPSEQTFTTAQAGKKTDAPEITIRQAGTNTYGGVITCATPGARIYYTVNGDEPTTASKEYSGYISEPLTEISVVKAIAVAPGLLQSDVAVKLVVGDKPADVKIEDKDVYGGKGVKLGTSTLGAYIYYTLDGTTPSAGNGTYYNGEEILVNIPGKVTLKAVATLPGYKDGNVAEKTYNLKKLQKPGVKTGGLGKMENGELISYKGMEVSYPGSESDVKLVYTTDGSVPGPDSNVYTSRVDFYENVPTVRVAAIKIGYVTSDEFVTSIKIEPTVPQLKVKSSKYVVGGIGVSLTCDLPGVKVYYTYDENAVPSIPVEDGEYILLSSPEQTIYAVGRKDGLGDSTKLKISVRSMGVAEAPTSNIATNSLVNVGDKIELYAGTYIDPRDDNKTAQMTYEIFYTTDGTEPTLESQRYTGPITINGETEIRAATAGIGKTLSPTAIFYYRIASEATGVEIDTTGLKNDGGLLHGRIKVSGANKPAGGGKAIIALYSGDNMLTAVTQELSSSMTFNIDENSRIMADGGSIVVKLFVFDSLGSLVPKCKAEKRIY
ncbi:MAG: chitobiase/beta-hexosaminidase C-terminal domain-containing protein [Oscillospiraceae bacterium]|nr:chitobiase/beta-hexosaminidase C-terminal domain-containing protein [Oscillospiraceae bacterium]